MSYEVSASRKRPKTFDELAGQDFVSATLKASIDNGRIAHAYLFSGPRGCGKTSTARILARSLNCEEGPSSKPCGVCNSCVSIARGSALDVIEIDGASNTSVENIRQIKDEVLFPPNTSKYKIYIIDEVHMLSTSAFNALLKTIEEPPPYIIFIFATTELHKVPATIKSRCQQFQFRLIPLDIIKEHLATLATELGIKAEEDALLWIAREARGSMRDAYTLFDQIASFSDGFIKTRLIEEKLGLAGPDRLMAIFTHCVNSRRAEALELLDSIIDNGVSVEQFSNDLIAYARSLLLFASGIRKESILGLPLSSFPPEIINVLDTAKLEFILSRFFSLYRDIRYSINPRWELELAIANLCSIKDYVPRAELAQNLEALKRSLGAAPLGAGPSGAAPAEPGQRSASTPARQALAPEPAEAVPLTGESIKESIITGFSKSHIMLSMCLQRTGPWELRENTMHVPCANGYDASTILAEIAIINRRLSDIIGRSIKLECRTEEAAPPKAEAVPEEVDKPDPVEIVEKAFRGKRISGQESQ